MKRLVLFMMAVMLLSIIVNAQKKKVVRHW